MSAAKQASSSASEAVSVDGTQLWSRIQQVYDTATSTEAASSIDTSLETVLSKQSGVRFLLRVAAKLKDKPQAKKTDPCAPTSSPSLSYVQDKPKPANPFLPYDENLWVAHLSATHTLLLNKFNVVAHHTLVVTREYEPQEAPLSPQDMAATMAVLGVYPRGALAYYNHGPLSGASQPHKHLQVVPQPQLPDDGDPHIPVEPIIRAALGINTDAQGTAAQSVPPESVQRTDVQPNLPNDTGIDVASGGAAVAGTAASGQLGTDSASEEQEQLVEVRALPFRAYASKLDPTMRAEQLAALAAAATAHAGLQPGNSYNVLMTQQWLLTVPRSAEGDGVVGANALGFAGAFLVRGDTELEHVKSRDPMGILAQLGVPW